MSSVIIEDFLPTDYEYRINYCNFLDEPKLYDTTVLPACTASFSFKGSTKEELYAWFEDFKVR